MLIMHLTTLYESEILLHDFTLFSLLFPGLIAHLLTLGTKK